MTKVLDFLDAVLVITLTVVGTVLFASGANEATHLLVELGTFDTDLGVTDFLLVNDATFLSNGLGSDNVVTSDHTDSNACILANSDSTWHFGADDIIDTKDSDKSDVGFLHILDLFVLRFVMQLTFLTWLQVTVTDANSSQGLFSVLLNDILNLFASVILDGTNFTLSVHEMSASLEDQLRGSLNKESLIVTAVSGSILDNSRHSLSAG